MIYEIENVKKRNILERIFSLDFYKVTIRDELGKQYNINCWAGVDDFDINSLTWDLNKKVCEIEERSKPKPKLDFGKVAKSALVGKKFVVANHQPDWLN